MEKVSVVHSYKDLDYIEIGAKITFKKDPKNKMDEDAIIAFFKEDKIGFISAQPKTMGEGTVSNHDIVNKVKDEFYGIVVDHQEIKTNKIKTILIVEIQCDSEKHNKQDEIMKGLILKVKGSINDCKKKMEVINQFRKGEKVFLKLELENEKIVLLKNGDKAGIVEEKDFPECSSLNEIKALKAILKENIDIELAEVYKTEKTDFYVFIDFDLDKYKSITNKALKEENKKIKEKLVKKGFNETILDEIEDYLLNNNFKIALIQKIFSTYKKYGKNVSHRIPKENPNYQDNSNNLKIGCSAIRNKCHILCSGEKGTGKNIFVETMAWIFQRPLYSISISKETDKFDLLGSKSVDTKVDENGISKSTIVFEPEILLEAMEQGGIINVDEINFADPGVTALLHSITDHRQSIEVPGYKQVRAEENFIVIGTMNVGYEGTSDLNEALSDRFVDILFESNNSIYSILKDSCPCVKQSDLLIADKVYSKLIDLIKGIDVELDESCMSIRGFIHAVKMSEDLESIKEALIVGVANKVRDTEYRENVKEVIEQICV
ncbi:TPA: AAA family ATPase [Clostridioides difficile]|uniref:AAA family ATPase n=1 Tax=Clostridioides difficile TaxID=1496 RepID=UPI001A279AA9|nr:AAA family ATPase [Clostridioides difficile]EGT3643026.1 nitric-oxide reductase [Clostridioides difficile]MBH7166076.1 AAA family ATPase [Clostridioides difficile]MBH7847168.1 AAA family ATPase [Clostridioides difficile]MBY1661505.1 AAA family ATPase [Clostridioides difficile]MCW0912390.1 AAA family ATPase [Clostridioides difficile]